MPHIECSSKILRPFTNPVWVQFRATYHLEKTLVQEETLSQKLSLQATRIVAGTCTPRYVTVHMEQSFFLSFFLSKLFLFVWAFYVNSLTEIEGIMYPFTLRIIRSKY